MNEYNQLLLTVFLFSFFIIFFFFWLLLDWQPKHTERNVVKVVGAVPASEKDRKLPADLDHHAFTKFTNIYFKVDLVFYFWLKLPLKYLENELVFILIYMMEL